MPTSDSIVTTPPTAASRSRMFMSPAPGEGDATANPAPSSWTSKRSLPVSDIEIQTPVAPVACLAAFCSASMHA